MVLFTDRDLGARTFPGRLRAAGLRVEAHVDHFRNDAPDYEWLPAVASNGWVILTNDQWIQRRVLERDSLMAAGAAVVAIVGGDSPALLLATNFVNAWPNVDDLIRRTPRPFIAKLYRPNPVERVWTGAAGDVRVVLTTADWRPGRR